MKWRESVELGTPELKEIGRFIRARREAALAATYDGLPARRRHVAHLTQGELAELVGVSIAVVSQIEQARYPNLSGPILQKISAALRLAPQQDLYLRGMLNPRAQSDRTTQPVPPWLERSLHSIHHPVIVLNPCYDILLHNDKAKALFGPYISRFLRNRNAADTIFGEPGLRTFFNPWLDYAASMVSGLKMSYALFPDFRDQIEVVAHRVEQTDETFRTLWHKADPLVKPTIEKVFNHPTLGELQVYQILTDLVEAKWLTRIEFIPANDETAEKMLSM